MRVSRTVLMAMLIAALLLAAGCDRLTSSRAREPRGPLVPHPTRTPAPPVEDLVKRKAMWEHAQAVWPSVRAGLTRSEGESTLSSAVAMASVMGTPTVEFRWAGGIPADASVWLGLAPLPDRTRYVIPVLYNGKCVASLTSHDYGGKWSVWPSSVEDDGATESLDAIAKAFGSPMFEWYYVNNMEGWVLAKRGDRVLGVLAAPILDHRKGDPPTGVLEGAKLRWALDHPLGY